MEEKKYSIVYTSNFLNHYQLALGKALNKEFKSYKFVAWDKLPKERAKLGFYDLNDNEFVIKAYEDKELARKTIIDADVVLGGYYLYENHMCERIKKGKLTLYSSERLFKTKNIIGMILRYVKYWTKYHKLYNNIPLLCVSAYAADDYNRIFNLFNNRTYKWGYFSEVKKYDDIDKLINEKKDNSIIWTGRLIKWKHPEYVIEVAKILKKKRYDFSIEIIGTGPLERKLKSLIIENKLDNNVFMLGSMNPKEVRKKMEESQVYLFTSDRGEGWGVVLNEAMNSACACVASYSAGSTPYLIKDNENGLVYKSNNVDDLIRKTELLLNNIELQKSICRKAYETMTNEWSPEVAAKRLYLFVDAMMNNKDYSNIFNDGILSKADRIKDLV